MRDGTTALHRHAARGALTAAALILSPPPSAAVPSRAALLSARDRESGWTPLHVAIYNRNYAAAALLLAAGARWETAHDNDGQTPRALLRQVLRSGCRASAPGTRGGSMQRQIWCWGSDRSEFVTMFYVIFNVEVLFPFLRGTVPDSAAKRGVCLEVQRRLEHRCDLVQRVWARRYINCMERRRAPATPTQ